MPQPDCPTPEELAALITDRLSGSDLRRVAAHIDRCPACLAEAGQLERAAQGAGTPRAGTPATAAPDAVGRYRTIRFHARGGLGEVHVAGDGELRRRVALKRIRADRAGDADSRRRFLREAEVTALLEHPGVVPVYGLVYDPAGQPCYAMRFIEGESLREALNAFHRADADRKPDAGARRLQLRQLLQRFVAVCQTVAYAHGQGVVHRDLKPANIMLGRYGETLVVDWGLAKALPPAPTPAARDTPPPTAPGAEGVTREGDAAGTPGYMSPEQAAGRLAELGPASDIYSLGATLYHLLTGRPPFEGSPGTILEQTQRGTFALPRQVKPALPRPLEAVCLKAMALDPGQRYPTAADLAADVERWLADEPVGAYRDPWVGRARRWARRHRALVSAAAAAGAVLLLALLISTALIGAAYRAEARQRQQADAAFDFLVEAFRSPDPKLDGKAITVAALLQRAEERLEQEPAPDPAFRGRMLDALARTYDALGLPDDAVRMFQRARDLRQEILGADHPDTLASVGGLALAWEHAGRSADAVPLLEDALRRSRAKLGEDHPTTLTSLNDLAWAYRDTGRAAEAIPLFEEALRRSRARLGEDHPTTLASMSNLAMAFQAAGRAAEAVPLLEQALRWSRARQGEDDPDTLTFLSNLGLVYQHAGRVAEAVRLHEEALRHRKSRLGEEHPDTVTSMNNLAMAYQAADRLADAVPLFEEALRRRRARLGENHPDTLTSMNNLATAYQQGGRLAEAVPLLEEVQRRFKAKLGEDHPDTLTSMNNLAMAYRATGRLAEALPLFEEALRRHRAKLGEDHPTTLTLLNNLALAYRATGRLAEAVPLFEEARRRSQSTLGDGHPSTLTLLNNLAWAYHDVDRPADALPLFERAIHWRRQQQPDSPALAWNLAGHGACLLRQEAPAQAEPSLREALAIFERKPPQSQPWKRAYTQTLLGAALAGQRKHAEAEPLLTAGYEALKAQEKVLPVWAQTQMRLTLDRLVRLYEDWGKPDRAAAWRARQPALPAKTP